MAENRTFEAPGPGSWELETTHCSKPVSLYTQGFFASSLRRGFIEGTERYGLFLSYIKYVFVNGFTYMKPILALVPEDAPPGPPPEGFFEQPELLRRFENGPRAVAEKRWREDLKRWDEEVKPDSIRRNQALQDVQTGSLDSEALIEHLISCYENLVEMWYRHHIFSVPGIFVTGLYLGKTCTWAGIETAEALALLTGSTDVSRGLAEEELDNLAGLLKQQSIAPDQFSGQPAAQVLETLRTMPVPIGPVVEQYLAIVGFQLTSGYDITEQYALEVPELLMGNIWSRVTKPIQQEDQAETRRRLDAVRNKIAIEHQNEFDTLLEEARFINRLRDERGLYGEAKAFGVARRAILEAGKRLEQAGQLGNRTLFLHASHPEMLAMLRGEDGPSNTELTTRQAWHENQTINDVPPFLGSPPEPPPPPEALPEIARLAETAIGTALAQLFDNPDDERSPDVIEGIAVSTGVYEGTARLIKSPADFARLQQGDVLVTKNTSATFNVVLPMLGAIVTDRGGQLSHAAIVSREYGIPGIVSTRNASRLIPDGARVRVDGEKGQVEILD